MTASEADSAVHTAIHHLQREQTPARLSLIVAKCAKLGLPIAEREADRALQRLRKRDIIKFRSKHGWLCRTFARTVTPAHVVVSL